MRLLCFWISEMKVEGDDIQQIKQSTFFGLQDYLWEGEDEVEQVVKIEIEELGFDSFYNF